MSQRLAGKAAIVTGGSKGIGAAIAKQLAAEGAAVVVNYASDNGAAESVVGAIAAAGGKAVAVQADLSQNSQIEHLFAETKKAFGRLDILVNNAGIYEFFPLEDVTEENFHAQFNLNVMGLLLACQQAVKLFDSKGGCIINIGSSITSRTPANSSVYCATKAAVDAVTGVLARELGPRKIRVNSVNPGLTVTEGTLAAGIIESDFRRTTEPQIPLGRLGQPQDIAPVVAFLASDDAAWVTGEIILASGGLR